MHGEIGRRALCGGRRHEDVAIERLIRALGGVETESALACVANDDARNSPIWSFDREPFRHD